MSCVPEVLSNSSSSNSTDIVVVSDLHLSGGGTQCPESPSAAADIVNEYADSFGADYVIDLGDSYEGLEAQEFIEDIRYPIEIVVGDENKRIWREEYIDGAIESDTAYNVHQEGFSKEINGFETEWVHHPNRRNRQFDSDFFSTEWADLVYRAEEKYPSMRGLDFVGWGHKHFDIPRMRGDLFEKGFGPFSHAYNVSPEMPSRSINIVSFRDDGIIENFHYDLESDELFEQVFVDTEDEWMIVDNRGNLGPEERLDRDHWQTDRMSDTAQDRVFIT